MKIYTGYYAKLKSYKEAGLFPISISLQQPEFYHGKVYKWLAPKWKYLRKPTDVYTAEFFKDMSRLNPNKVVEQLRLIGKGRDVVLLCYEKPSDFCHRQLVSHWLKKTLGIDVYEFGQSGPKVTQKTLDF